MKHFKPEEFKCRCNYNCGLGYAQMDEIVLTSLDDARSIADVPFIITSAVRCPQHNLDVGGTLSSSHLIGRAVDIYCTSSKDRYAIVAALIKVGFQRIGIGTNFIHCDGDITKPQSAIFTYY